MTQRQRLERRRLELTQRLRNLEGEGVGGDVGVRVIDRVGGPLKKVIMYTLN